MRLYFSSGIFWGIVFVLIGILLLIKNYTNLYIPVFRTLFGLLIIYWGISILFGGFSHHSESSAVFTSNTINANSKSKNYSTVFGKSIINFTDSSFSDIQRAKIDVVFGEAIIRVNKNIPLMVKINNAFSNASTPGNEITFLGTYTYTNKAFEEGKPYLLIETNVVFSRLKIEEF